MFEIENKAWVYNRSEVINKLNSFAEYICSIEKSDVYYHFPVEKDGKPVGFRLRKEIINKNGNLTYKNTFTYKKKEIRKNQDGSTIEVNSENEFSLDVSEPLVLMAGDLGAVEHLRKIKKVECWHLNTVCGTANIELCNVPPLGDFLEIEIVTENGDLEFVQKAKLQIEKIISDCNIPLSDIEPRYYSQLLKEAGAV